MSRLIAPFGVRMPPELKEKVEEAAKANGRSMNAEVIHRLEQSFEQEPPSAGNATLDDEKLLQQLLDRIQHIEKLLMEKK